MDRDLCHQPQGNPCTVDLDEHTVFMGLKMVRILSEVDGEYDGFYSNTDLPDNPGKRMIALLDLLSGNDYTLPESVEAVVLCSKGEIPEDLKTKYSVDISHPTSVGRRMIYVLRKKK